MHFTVNNVIYGHLRGDGSEQAAVLTGCNLGGTGYWTEAFLFDFKAGKPVQIDNIGGGDRAMGGIESVRIGGHSLHVAQQYGIALCCADYIESTTYVLRGNRLVATSSKRVSAATRMPLKALRFERGTSFAFIDGRTRADSIYEFRARNGQVLLIEVQRETEAIPDYAIHVMGPDGMTLKQERDGKLRTMRLPADGLYTLVISSNQPDSPYRFKVTIQ